MWKKYSSEIPRHDACQCFDLFFDQGLYLGVRNYNRNLFRNFFYSIFPPKESELILVATFF